MFIKSVGINYRHNKDFVKNAPYGTNEYIVLLIKSKALFVINGETFHVEPNSLIIYRKGSTQYFRADNTEFVNDWICFDLDEGDETFFENVKIKFDTLYRLTENMVISELMKIIHQEQLSDNLYTKQSVSAYMKILFYKISECINSEKIFSKQNFTTELLKIRTMIYNNPTKWWSVKELASEISLSVSYFQHLYKTQFSISPVSDVIRSRIKYAKYLLVSTNYSVRKISDKLNYGSDIQFIQQFKKVTGTTPLNYRRQHNNL